MDIATSAPAELRGASGGVGRVRVTVFCEACEHRIPEGEIAEWRGDGGAFYALHVGPCGGRDERLTVAPTSGGLDAIEARVALTQALSALPYRERLVIVARYGLDGGAPLTLDAVSIYLDITRERVRQIQKIALDKLRVVLSGEALPPPPRSGPRPRPIPLEEIWNEPTSFDLETLVPDFLLTA